MYFSSAHNSQRAGDQTVKSDVTMPDFKSSYQKMEKIASSLNAELANFHVGRANAEMLVHISHL